MIQTTHYKLNTPCRIALLTDMHDQPWEDAFRALETEKPDVICIAGDLLRDDYHSSFEEEVNILPFLRACVSQAPTFFSFGNHEWCMTPEQIEQIKDLGVRVLDNEWTEWTSYTDCNDCTDYVLPLEVGDEVSVVEITSEGYFVKHDGVSGWYFGELE